MKRRTFLQGTLVASAASLAVGAGLLTPRLVMAEGDGAFDAKSLEIIVTAGDKLKLSWTDNKGEKDSAEADAA